MVIQRYHSWTNAIIATEQSAVNQDDYGFTWYLREETKASVPDFSQEETS